MCKVFFVCSVLWDSNNHTGWWAFFFFLSSFPSQGWLAVHPCPNVTHVITRMWHRGACLSLSGWLLMGDYTPNANVIRTGDLITHHHMMVCSSMHPRRKLCAVAYVFIHAYESTQQWLHEERKGHFFSFLLVCFLSFRSWHVFCMTERVWQSVSMCDDERPGKKSRKKRKRQLEKKKNPNKHEVTHICVFTCICLSLSCLYVAHTAGGAH